MSKRRKKSSRRPGAGGGSFKKAHKLARQFDGGPVFPSPNTMNYADQYLNAFAHYEDWITAGKPENELIVSALPAEHRVMIEYWPEAFEAYRHAMWTYLERAASLNPWASTMRSLMNRIRLSDPSGFQTFLSTINDAIPWFIEQKRNAVLLQQATEGPDDKRRKYRASLQAYTNFYEVELPMWFLAVLGRAVRTGSIDVDLFGGPNSETAQGSLVNGMINELAGTPLEKYIKDVYDPTLRNIIQHNDYEIEIEPDQVSVAKLDGTVKWDGATLYQRVTGAAQIIEAVQSVVAHIQMVEDPSQSRDFPQVGLVGVMYQSPIDQLPHAIVLQLWCFHEMDSLGKWLDGCVVEFQEVDDGGEKVKFTEHAYTIGEPVSGQLWTEADSDREWMRVTRFPVAPDFGQGYPTVERPDGARYEIVGVADSHVIRVGKT